MKNRYIYIIISCIILFCILLSISSFYFTFGVMVLPLNSSVILPEYLKEQVLLTQLKWVSKINLPEVQVEKIKQINKSSIKLFEEFFNFDFLILLEIYSENSDCRIHLYSFYHDIYCGNLLLRLDNLEISTKILNLIHIITLKTAHNKDKNNFQKIMQIYFSEYKDENYEDIFIVPEFQFNDYLLLDLFSKYSSEENILNYYIKVKNSITELKNQNENQFSSIIYNVCTDICKSIVNNKFYDKILIDEINFNIIKKSHIKMAIANLLKSKYKNIYYEILSFLLLQ